MSVLWSMVVTVSDVVPPAVWLAAALALVVLTVRLILRPYEHRVGPASDRGVGLFVGQSVSWDPDREASDA